MENLEPNQELKKDPSLFYEHKKFFSGENIKKLLGNGLMITGSVFVLAGIYEGITGDKIGHLIQQYEDKLPHFINLVLNHIDSIPPLKKTGAGSGLITSGLALDGYFDELFDKENEGE